MSVVAEALALPKAETPFRRLAREFFSNRVATAAFALLALIVALALFAPLIAPQNPYALSRVTVLDARLDRGTGRRYEGSRRGLTNAIACNEGWKTNAP